MDAPLCRIESLKTLHVHHSTSSAREVYSNTPWRCSSRNRWSSLKFTLRRFFLHASCVRKRGKEISKDREECTTIEGFTNFSLRTMPLNIDGDVLCGTQKHVYREKHTTVVLAIYTDCFVQIMLNVEL